MMDGSEVFLAAICIVTFFAVLLIMAHFDEEFDPDPDIFLLSMDD